MYATGAAIGNGQFTVQIITALASGLILTRRDPRGWHARILMLALILMAFIKPNIAGFFFWILLFVPDSPRPALLVMSGYISLTLFAAVFPLWPCEPSNPEEDLGPGCIQRLLCNFHFAAPIFFLVVAAACLAVRLCNL